jgi:hypothetical protein
MEILKFVIKHNYIITIIIFFIILLCINHFILFKNGHFYSDEDKLIKTDKDIRTDSFYFTTTQFSTIGYGDLTPKTNMAKMITSISHILIIFISLKLMAEFGILSTESQIQVQKIDNDTKKIQDDKCSLNALNATQSSNFITPRSRSVVPSLTTVTEVNKAKDKFLESIKKPIIK